MLKLFLSKIAATPLMVCAILIAGSMSDVQAAPTTQDAICAGLEQSLPRIDIREARQYMSNVTYRNNSLGHGNQIEHATTDGRVFLWYPGNRVILPGRWKLVETELTMGAWAACHRKELHLCFQYGANTYNPVTGARGAGWECEMFKHFRETRAEIVPGDPLGLATMSVPPFPLSSWDQSIGQVKAQLPR